MSLDPVPGTPGLWQNGTRPTDMPGLFAVIIGVSRYDYLRAGAHEVPETYGLGQLNVSALTAFRVFQWLSERYFVESCPLAQCWLLLSPTDEELQEEPALATHLLAPTFANCERAIGAWRANLQGMPPQAAPDARALFFFSGHGLEVHQEQQILLPRDYLEPPLGNVNKAISTQNLRNGLADLVPRLQFFFLDACRSGHPALRAQKLTGTKILNEPPSENTNPDLIVPVMYATASGQQAFQQPHPSEGISLFGDALLDGLHGLPNIELQCKGPFCSVNLYPLQGFVKHRVVELIAKSGEQAAQPVKLSGSVDNAPITYIDAKTPVHRPGKGPAPSGSAKKPGVFGFRREPRPGAGALRGDARDFAIQTAIDLTLTRTSPVPTDLPRSIWAQDSGIGHQLFGSELVTELWSKRLRVFAQSQNRWIDDPDAVVLHQVDFNPQTGQYRLDLNIADADPYGHWLELVDFSGVMHACMLPMDPGEPPRYSVEMQLRGTAIVRFEVYLSTSGGGAAAAAGRLWQRYRNADLGSAVHAYEASALEQLLRDKMQSPLAATVAGLVLLRANRLDLLHDWLRNLANWFPYMTDGPVLWAEQLMRQSRRGKTDPAPEAADYLTRVLEHGFPVTFEGLSYAAALSERLGDSRLPASILQKLEEVRIRVGDALALVQPEGLFVSYSALNVGISPLDVVWPTATAVMPA